MADIDIQRRHNFEMTDARERLEGLLNGLRERKPDLVKEVTWDGDTATASGKHFKGSFVLSSSDVKVEVKLIGFAAKLVKGVVRDQIKKELEQGGFVA